MAIPSPQGNDYVAFTAHVWVNRSTGQVQIASADSELSMILAISKTKHAGLDAAARELLRRHGKAATRR